MKRFFGTLLGLVLAFGVGALIYNSVRVTPNDQYHSASKDNLGRRIKMENVDRTQGQGYTRLDDGTMRERRFNTLNTSNNGNSLNDWLNQIGAGNNGVYFGGIGYNGNYGGNAGNYGGGNAGNYGGSPSGGYNGNTGNTPYNGGNTGANNGSTGNAGNGAQNESGTPVDSTVASQILQQVNAERAKAGVQPLTLSTQLNKVAQVKSNDMRDKNYFDHNSPTYGSPFDMMKSFGISYSYAGENIAAGQQSVQAVMTAWMNSPGHRQNILSSNYTQLGVGYAKGGNMSPYWTQEFTRP
ncbi:CAP domain-containing protein [Paenibacillus sp. R14(2021)]|uniref:CAP domain-containing protein n=1 Tax=Paenibacillus sp. R14(2021) TaxID=2859228 RepID=UPI002157ECD1|nr:CAP domain-containing protein [Paenibacillus sp. R14(2021)]